MRLAMSEVEYEELRATLLGDEDGSERAAFLLAKAEASGDELRVIRQIHPTNHEFDQADWGYLELRDGVLHELIREAHALGAALVEAHSHPFDRSDETRFSSIDRDGLAEVAPHVVWRLPGRPYLAFVFGHRGFDSLYWSSRTARPSGVVDIDVGIRVHSPTGLTLRAWGDDRGPI